MYELLRKGAVLLLGIVAASPVAAITMDFAGHPAGTVVAGEEPGGGTAPGTLFPGFTVLVDNAIEFAPDTAIIFDSANPTGGDLDLGSPNDTCDDGLNNGTQPGVGVGGEVGQEGENCDPLGNLLIIAENIDDVSPEDGLVDDPDDMAGGGYLQFDFDETVVVHDITLIDIDNDQTTISLDPDGTLQVVVAASNLGDNAVETIPLATFGDITRMRVTFSTSGGVARFSYTPAPLPTQQASWSSLKNVFRAE